MCRNRDRQTDNTKTLCYREKDRKREGEGREKIRTLYVTQREGALCYREKDREMEEGWRGGGGGGRTDRQTEY